MSNKFIAIAGAAVAALGIAAANLDDPFEGQSCAISADGDLVATKDGVNFHHLNDEMGEKFADAAFWVEGTAGWGGGPVCVTRDAEFSMPMKDLPRGAVIQPQEFAP